MLDGSCISAALARTTRMEEQFVLKEKKSQGELKKLGMYSNIVNCHTKQKPSRKPTDA